MTEEEAEERRLLSQREEEEGKRSWRKVRRTRETPTRIAKRIILAWSRPASWEGKKAAQILLTEKRTKTPSVVIY